MEELIEEILLRFPPHDPALLVHAALVCKQWCRLVSGAGFRRRFREFHRTPPMLGFLYSSRSYCSRSMPAKFVRTAASCGPADCPPQPLLGGDRCAPWACTASRAGQGRPGDLGPHHRPSEGTALPQAAVAVPGHLECCSSLRGPYQWQLRPS